jgi:hypothetical protein
MFAYCNNNPILYADPTGCVPIFPVCWGGSTALPQFVGTSDGSQNSDSLLQYVQENYSVNHFPFSGNSVFVSVEYDGVYNRLAGAIDDALRAAVGFGVSKIPHPLALAFGKGLEYASTLSLILPFVDLVDDPFPDGKYLQYTVTMTWTTAESPCGYPSVLMYTEHIYTMTYVWNDANPEEPYWHLRGSRHTTVSNTHGI